MYGIVGGGNASILFQWKESFEFIGLYFYGTQPFEITVKGKPREKTPNIIGTPTAISFDMEDANLLAVGVMVLISLAISQILSNQSIYLSFLISFSSIYLSIE